MGFAKGKYLLDRDVATEYRDIQKKGRKRSLWSSIGMGIGGLAATALTGGAAAPLMAGLASAGGTYVGGQIGDIAARQTGARIKGKGKFLKGSRKGVVQNIQDTIGAGSVKAGFMAGAHQFKSLKGKGLGDVFKAGKGAQTEGLGKLFDYKGSTVGKKISAAESAKTGRELIAQGKASLGSSRYEGSDWMDIDITDKLQKMKMDEALASEISPSSIRGQYQSSIPELSKISKVDVPPAIPEVTGKGGILSSSERGVYDTINKMTDEGYSVGVNRGLPKEFGRGYIGDSGEIVRAPSKLNVSAPNPFEETLTKGEQLKADAYKTLDINQEGYSDLNVNRAFGKLRDYNASQNIESPGFSEFGNWEKPVPRPLTKEFQTTNPLRGMQRQIEGMPPSFKRGNLPRNYPLGDDIPEYMDFEETGSWKKRFFG